MRNHDDTLVYRVSSSVEAHALAAELANVGIEARVLGEALQGGYAGLNLGGMNWPEVWIAGKDREQAVGIIQEWEAGRIAAVTASSRRPVMATALFVALLLSLLLIGIG